VAATRAGDDYAFERLYKRYQRRIAAYVVGMVHDHGRAEDITQEVFMSALRRMRETERPIVFKPWVYEIAKNACIDAFRRSKRAEEISYDAEEGLGGSDYGRLVSSTPAPDAAVDTRQSLDHLRGAFGGLSETHHDILVMRELEGLSYREIGRRLGMSRPSVESTLFRARRRLSEEYEELTSGERCKRVQTMIAGGGERRLGVRDERKLARHVSHCQPCRRAAYAAGFDVAELQRKTSLGAKVAALLPFPAFVKRWFGRGGDGGGSAAGGADGGSSSSLAQWSATVGQHAEPISGWAKAAAVAATVAVAGVGAGVATTHGDADVKAPRPAAAGSVPASAASAAAAAKAAAAATTGLGRATVSSSRRSAAKAPSSTSRAKRGAARRAGGGSGSGSGGGSGSAGGGGSSAGGGSAPASAPAGSGAGSASSSAKAGVSAPKLNAPQVQAPKTGNTTVDSATGAVTGTVDKTAGAATGAVNNATGAATGAVDGAVGAVGGAVNQATGGAAGGAVNGATGAATGAVNGATGAVNGAVGTATGAVSNPTGTVTGAASDPAGTVGGAVGGLLPHG
jgi:RNA polymerase sigma factor (sigma-70 family)